MRRKFQLALLILALILLGFPALSAAQEKAPPNVPQAFTPAPPAEKAPPGSPAKVPAPAPDPKQVLQQMCDFLKNQHQFSFKAEVYNDQVFKGRPEAGSLAWMWRPFSGARIGSGSTAMATGRTSN